VVGSDYNSNSLSDGQPAAEKTFFCLGLKFMLNQKIPLSVSSIFFIFIPQISSKARDIYTHSNLSLPLPGIIFFSLLIRQFIGFSDWESSVNLTSSLIEPTRARRSIGVVLVVKILPYPASESGLKLPGWKLSKMVRIKIAKILTF
jgi:hypothetical protein